MSKKLLLVFAIAAFISACNNPKKETAKKYLDYMSAEFRGDIQSVQDSSFVVDSMGHIKPDSMIYGLEEFKDGYISSYTDIDTAGRKSSSTYVHYDNGLLKNMQKTTNGKVVYKLDIQLDSAGRFTTAQSYDSTDKMDYFNTDLQINDFGMLTKGKLFKKDSTLLYSFTQEFDSSVFKSSNSYDSTGKLTSKEIHVSNEHGDPITETTITYKKDTSETKVEKFSYTYDDKGNWLLSTEMNEKGKPVKITKRVIVYAKKEG